VPARRQSQSKKATRLARLRIERGMSQTELAEASGLSIATLRRLERGTIANPPLRYLANCAIVLGVKVEELIEDEWREWIPLAQREPPASPEALWLPGRYNGEPQ
jgi:transcriptional regulator with XRE-family HTH domain